MSSIRDIIFNADDIFSDTVTVPEWDNVVIEIRSPTAAVRNKMLASFSKPSDDDPDVQVVDTEQLYPAVIVITCFDPESGELLFTDDDKGWLMEKNGKAVQRVAEVALRMSGLADAEEAVEAGKVDSSGTPTVDISSSSPSDSA